LKTLFGTASVLETDELHNIFDELESRNSDWAHSLTNQLTYVKKLDTVTAVCVDAITNLSYVVKDSLVQSHDEFQQIVRDMMWFNVTLNLPDNCELIVGTWTEHIHLYYQIAEVLVAANAYSKVEFISCLFWSSFGSSYYILHISDSSDWWQLLPLYFMILTSAISLTLPMTQSPCGVTLVKSVYSHIRALQISDSGLGITLNSTKLI
jgi:hypothetical protein